MTCISDISAVSSWTRWH